MDFSLVSFYDVNRNACYLVFPWKVYREVVQMLFLRTPETFSTKTSVVSRMSLSFTGGLDKTVWNDSAAHSKSTTISANLKIKYNVSVFTYPRAHAWKISMIIQWDNSVLACKGIVTVI